MDAKTGFHWADYIVLVLMLMVSLGIGLWHAWRGKRQKTTEEYLMGGRQLQFIPITLSLAVSVVSTNTLLGTPAEAYSFGIQYGLWCIAMMLAAVIVGITFVPLMFPLKFTSANEYLEKRFDSKSVRFFGTFSTLITQILYIGCVIFGPAIALQPATGIQPRISILLVSVLGTGYTAVGGIKAVIWTDTFQAVVMLFGVVTVIILGSNSIGGFSNVININEKWGRIYVDTSFDPTTRLTLSSTMIGGTFLSIATFGVFQPSFQRYCAMRTQRQAQISMCLNGVLVASFVGLSLVAGMVAFAFYATAQCDVVETGVVKNANQILLLFVMEVLSYPGLVGLFVSSLFCASLSTVSSSLNSMAAVVWEDILKLKLSHLTESRKTMVTKLLVVILGIISTAASYLVLEVGGNIQQLSVSFGGATFGPLLGVFLLGALFPFANWKGALCGGIVSLAFNIWLTFGQVMTKRLRTTLPGPTVGCKEYLGQANLSLGPNDMDPAFTVAMSYQPQLNITNQSISNNTSGLGWLYSVSFFWYTPIGIIICVTVAIVVSLISECRAPENSKRIYLFKCVRRCVKAADESDVNMQMKINVFDGSQNDEETKVLTNGNQ